MERKQRPMLGRIIVTHPVPRLPKLPPPPNFWLPQLGWCPPALAFPAPPGFTQNIPWHLHLAQCCVVFKTQLDWAWRFPNHIIHITWRWTPSVLPVFPPGLVLHCLPFLNLPGAAALCTECRLCKAEKMPRRQTTWAYPHFFFFHLERPASHPLISSSKRFHLLQICVFTSLVLLLPSPSLWTINVKLTKNQTPRTFC